jgi:hypothetical protein
VRVDGKALVFKMGEDSSDFAGTIISISAKYGNIIKKMIVASAGACEDFRHSV